MPNPQLVIVATPGEFIADYQGAYSATVTYQKQQMVRVSENIWSCTQKSTGHTPEEGSAFWKLLGDVESIITPAIVKTEREATEAAAQAEAESLIKAATGLGAYSGKTEQATGKEIEESAVSRKLVTLSIESKTATRTLVEVKVNKVFAGQVGCSVTSVGKDELSITFACPAKQKWEAVVVEGSVEKLYSSSVVF
jgi:hypothetical protein